MVLLRHELGTFATAEASHASILRLSAEATMEGAASYARHWSIGKGKGVRMGPTFVVTSLEGGEWESILHILSHLILFASCVCTTH
jgi:hypothetical protein